MNEKLQIIFGLLGGLAVFIYGMNMMSECLQKAAGEKMKSILALLTKNPVLGVIAGALTTAVLQSSSATTVMAIGFVSAGLMSLPQAISIIFGANIGTTMTAQIIAFKISDNSARLSGIPGDPDPASQIYRFRLCCFHSQLKIDRKSVV